jgi:hypothetical protein
MRQRSHVLAAAFLAAGVLGLAAPSSHAQDKPAPATEGATEGEGSAEGAEALVKRIQSSLGEVDKALQQASEAKTATAGVEAAKRKHLEVIRDIDALIKQIKYQQSNKSQSGGGGKSSSDDKLSGKSAPQPSDGSQAPTPSSGKSSKPKSKEEQDAEQQQQGKKPAGSEGRASTPGGNEQGAKLPPDETGKFTRTDTDARWGLLPPKLQERLMNLHVDDVPERYRAWLDAYIHALNAREQEGRTR